MHSKKNIVIVGSGVESWITAIYLKIALLKMQSSINVVLVFDISEPPSGFSTVLNNISSFNHDVFSLLNGSVPESCFSHFDEMLYSGWSNSGKSNDRFHLSFNSVEIPELGEKFLQHWIKQKSEGYQGDFNDLMRALIKLSVESAVKDRLEDVKSGVKFDNHEYWQLLREAGAQLDITIYDAGIKSINAAEDRIQSISLLNGVVIEAELFVDASQSAQTLIQHLGSVEHEDWSKWFGCDRLITGYILQPATTNMSEFLRLDNGWISIHSVGNEKFGFKLAFSSLSPAPDLRVSLSKLGVGPNSRIEILSDSSNNPGILLNPWINNCLAVGSAACRLDQISMMDFQPLLMSLTLLSDYLSYNLFGSAFLDSYNKKYYGYMSEIKSFQMVHYLSNSCLNAAEGISSENLPIPSELMERLELFKSNGCFIFHEYEFFEDTTWIQLFMGLGFLPKNVDPTIYTSDDSLSKILFDKHILNN